MILQRLLVLVVVLWIVAAGTALSAEAHLPPLPGQAPGPYAGLDAAAHAGAHSFALGEPVVGCTYFYWYDVESNAHIVNGDGSDALTTHPADMTELSFRSTPWHRAQMEDMLDAGIDFLMPVFWGVPGQYTGWSFAGLPPLVEAHDALLSEGKQPPRIGLFFDTSILRFNGYAAAGEDYHVDLTTPFGRQWLYTCIRDFFSMIPPEKWARVEGKPIVFLYAGSFARAQSAESFQELRTGFQRDFGCEPFIVKMRDWQGEADAQYQWGGAIHLMLDKQVAALGPGYDHSAVPGRDPLIVDREFGRHYADSWLRILRLPADLRPWMVHVETWNEWHEGTDIADSREYGRHYIVLTRLFSDMWRAGQLLNPVGPFVDSRSVTWDGEAANGIALRKSSGDGVWLAMEHGGRAGVVSDDNALPADSRYLYFNVDDGFALLLKGGAVTLEITYWDSGCDAFAIEYDSTDLESGPLNGSFRHGGHVWLGHTQAWKTASFDLEQCRFDNRANDADFRLAVHGGEKKLAVCRVAVTRR
ncbi:MAG: DUF5010 domain-containing protein [Candidatus Hydrogenedentales bacterium]|jgi:hypothetical protein